ncbi:MAG: MmcQ/YjbR family DNA-binding protein [Gemmatimonadaceae bacterium]|nr:MmcQ/YjbR family DNA-binding protein [Gemmatimonadaceae bacterium]
MVVDPIVRLRAACLALPEGHEVEAWGEPTFRVRNKIFAMYASASTHHGRGRPGVWIKAKAENQQLLVSLEPARFFVPPYVGPSGWIGVWLDKRPRWREIEELLYDGYRQVAPKRLLAEHDSRA